MKMQRNCDCDWKKGNSKKRDGRCGIQIKSRGKSHNRNLRNHSDRRKCKIIKEYNRSE